MPLFAALAPIFTRLRRLALVGRLAREAGRRHLAALALFTGLSSLLDIAGLGVGVSLLLGAGPGGKAGPGGSAGLALLVGLMLVRGLLQAWIAIGQERLRSGFTDRLRQQLLSQVLQAPAEQLNQLGRGALLGLLMGDISRSVFALDQGLRCLQALLALALYAAGVLLVGRDAALPLVLALLATGGAALLQRSGSWQLGRLQSRLNGGLQRTVGDGLHGLKAVRAAAAEPWLLRRFAADSHRVRQVLRQTVQRQALFNALRDTLVVAYRSGTALSGVIGAQRSCLGALPGYQELCRRRALLTPPQAEGGATLPAARLAALERPEAWQALSWQAPAPADTADPPPRLRLQRGVLVAVVGPSGSGKTTLLDRFCGLLAAPHSVWHIHTGAGEARLSGAAGARQLRRLLACAPQQAVLFEASLRHNLLLDQQQPTEVIEAWLERLGLVHLLQRGAGLDEPLALALDQCSGGEIHRLGLLRAWLRDRPVEVLDEPTAFLDATSAERVRAILLERSRQRLVLVSTHDPELIRRADQLVQLQAGDRAAAERLHQRNWAP